MSIPSPAADRTAGATPRKSDQPVTVPEFVAAKSREMAQKQASAAEAIEDDPFVRDLVRDLGAEVVTSSIRPAEGSAGPTNDKR